MNTVQPGEQFKSSNRLKMSDYYSHYMWSSFLSKKINVTSFGDLILMLDRLPDQLKPVLGVYLQKAANHYCGCYNYYLQQLHYRGPPPSTAYTQFTPYGGVPNGGPSVACECLDCHNRAAAGLAPNMAHQQPHHQNGYANGGTPTFRGRQESTDSGPTIVEIIDEPPPPPPPSPMKSEATTPVNSSPPNPKTFEHLLTESFMQQIKKVVGEEEQNGGDAKKSPHVAEKPKTSSRGFVASTSQCREELSENPHAPASNGFVKQTEEVKVAPNGLMADGEKDLPPSVDWSAYPAQPENLTHKAHKSSSEPIQNGTAKKADTPEVSLPKPPKSAPATSGSSNGGSSSSAGKKDFGFGMEFTKFFGDLKLDSIKSASSIFDFSPSPKTLAQTTYKDSLQTGELTSEMSEGPSATNISTGDENGFFKKQQQQQPPPQTSSPFKSPPSPPPLSPPARNPKDENYCRQDERDIYLEDSFDATQAPPEPLRAHTNDEPLDPTELDFKSACVFCPARSHTSALCPAYPPKDRLNRALDLGRCLKCLSFGHQHAAEQPCLQLHTIPACSVCGITHLSFLFH